MRRKNRNKQQKKDKENAWSGCLGCLGWLGGIFLILFVFAVIDGIWNDPSKIPDKPAHSTVLDRVDYLSKPTIEYIDELNERWADTDQRLQVGVYVTNSLGEENLEEFSNAIFRKWKPGYAGTDNGVMLVIAIADRKFRLETSNNVAIKVTDVEAKRILESAQSYFRSGSYDRGTRFIVSEVGKTFYGDDAMTSDLVVVEEPKGMSWYESLERGPLRWVLTIVVLIFLMMDWFGGGRSSGGGSDSGGSTGGWSGGGGDGGGASSGW